jgi:hypothetical protein
MSAAPLKILVVDDAQGYEILEAMSGKASLDLLARIDGDRDRLPSARAGS